jgi:hypothetical protein
MRFGRNFSNAGNRKTKEQIYKKTANRKSNHKGCSKKGK